MRKIELFFGQNGLFGSECMLRKAMKMKVKSLHSMAYYVPVKATTINSSIL